MKQLRIKTQITVRNEALERYLISIAKYELLSFEEEVDLAEKIQNGDKHALDSLVNSNLRFVVSVAKQQVNSDPEKLLDLIAEGNIGLIKAAKRFDSTRGFKFISYAVWWIRMQINLYVSENYTTLKTASNTYANRNKILNFSLKYEQDNGFEPSVEELSKNLGIPESNINAIKDTTNKISGDLKLENSDGSVFDFIPGGLNSIDNINDKAHTNNVLNEFIAKHLTKRERYIIKKSFGLDEDSEHSLGDIADELSLSKERVRQLKDQALRNLKTILKRKNVEL